MPRNPMQRKALNAFFLGFALMLVIAIIGVAAYYVLVVMPEDEKEETMGVETLVYALNQDVKSGQVVTANMLSQITVYNTMIPSNYVDQATFYQLSLQTKTGYDVNTDEDGKLFIMEGETKVILRQGENGTYTKATDGSLVELAEEPMVAKIDMTANTIVTSDSIARSGELTTNDLRLAEYNMLTLPTTLSVGDYIDVRLTFANGQDLIVLTKKRVESLFGNTIGLYLTEDEILYMNSAIVESYIMTASNLYVIQYVEPGMQEESYATYEPTVEVQNLIKANNNIVKTARVNYSQRFANENSKYIRGYIDVEASLYKEGEKESIETGIQAQIEEAKTAREEYLAGLTAVPVEETM